MIVVFFAAGVEEERGEGTHMSRSATNACGVKWREA
jgi:hypothetical protein